MDSDLTQTQSVNGTDTPQAAANIGASDASPFQQSASADALKQNKAIQVTPNGNAITGSSNNAGMSATAIVFIVVSSIVLVMIASSVFRWVMKRPEPVKVEKPEKALQLKLKKDKKKLPRSKRRKN
jgi:hypothetical protein